MMKAREAKASKLHGRNGSAYTLVESLVVMAILSILVGILLPSLQAVRREARSSVVKGQRSATSNGVAGEQPVLTEACCFVTAPCQNLPVGQCLGSGGSPRGPGSSCNPTVCSNDGACCLETFCGVRDISLCQEIGGTFQGFGTDCTPNPCLPTGACCADGCSIETRADCERIGGPYLGDGTDCRDDTLCQPDRPCDQCGGVAHWGHDCPAGFDNMQTGAVVAVSIDPNSCDPDANLVLGGPVFIRHTAGMEDSINFPGLSTMPQHLDVIDTEILAMDLVGGGVVLRAGFGHGDNADLRPSLGAIVERPGDVIPADSFFDVFFEIDLGVDAVPNRYLYNQDPLRVSSEITCLPPDATYYHPVGCVKLFTSPRPDEGQHVANLVTANHSTYPTCGDPGAGPCNQPHDTPFCDNEACCNLVCESNSACCTESWNVDCAGLAQQICIPTGACCAQGSCAEAGTGGGTFFASCSYDLGCYCFKSADGSPACANNYFCEGRTPCSNGQGDCGAGEVCVVESCCGSPVCAPAGCDPAATAAIPTDATGSTGAHRAGQVAGVLPGVGPCLILTADDCLFYGGVYHGDESTCAAAECIPPGACCLPNGVCGVTTAERCRIAGGVPRDPGTECVGDHNGDGLDDVCPAKPCEECGPGAHWIHDPPCPPGGVGEDIIPSGAVAALDLDDDCFADVNFVLSGPVRIGKRGPRDDSVNFPGLRPNDLHLDVIDTEMLAMSLTNGAGITLRAGGGGPTPLRPSLGAIAENVGDPNLADSFFDVFFEISDGVGLTAYNHDPIKVATTITCLPPDGIYAHITGCTPLYDSPFPGKGTFIANLVSANHFTYPGCCFEGQCRELPGNICEAEGGRIVPGCAGDNNGNDIDDGCETPCEPTPDGAQCRNGTCLGRAESCRARCVTREALTGRFRVRDCDCVGPQECHVQIPLQPTVAGVSECVVPDNGGGTVNLPPAGCPYLSPDDVHVIIDGLPAGTTIEFGIEHSRFFEVLSAPGGNLGGEAETFQSSLALNMNGTGALAGFNRALLLPAVQCETHVGPRMANDPIQSFDTDMFRLQGQLPIGDPDFDLLRITAGSGFGMPSPGHTTLTQLPGGNWAVDSFFDITYRIDFVGNPGGPLAGRSGSTTGTIRMQTVSGLKCAGGCAQDEVCAGRRSVDKLGNVTLCCVCDEDPTEACCLPDGRCDKLTRPRCIAAGGIPLGPDAACYGEDGNGNGRDDACDKEPPCDDCGPGDHWIDQCPGGADVMSTGALVGVDLLKDDDCEADVSSVLFGPAFVARSNPQDDSAHFPGLRPMDGHLDVIDTEIMSMTLTGGGLTLRAGGGMGVGGPLRRSLGAMAERPGDPAAVDSFFDVFFEVELGAGQFAYNQVPVIVRAVIDCVPPDTTYIHILECIPLFNAPTGGHIVAFLTEARHGTNPTCGSDVTGGCFDPHDTPYCNKDECCQTVCELRPHCCTDQWDQACVAAANALCVPGACCIPTACNDPGTCGVGFPNCGENPECFCAASAEGTGQCVRDAFCDGVTPCPNGSSDCAAGEVCTVETCCVEPICLPLGCVATTSAVEVPGIEPSTVTPGGGAKAFDGARVTGGAAAVGVCRELSRVACGLVGGTYQGPNTVCEPKTCLPPFVEVDVFPNTGGEIVVRYADGIIESIQVSGPTEVHVFFDGPTEGDANDSNGNDLDDVGTQMRNLHLTGNSSHGPVIVRTHPTIPSLGGIEEKANNTPGTLDLPPFTPTGAASSFFDVFFEIEIGGQTFHTRVPKHMSGQITHKPPTFGDLYEGPEDIELFDANNNPTGIVLLGSRHIPRPPVEVDQFPATTARFELQFPGGGGELIDLSGPTTVHVFFEGDAEGDAADNDGDDLDEVQTLLVSVELTGMSEALGEIKVRLHPTKPSRGEIEETANTQPGRLDLPPFAPDGTASSFFDVFFEVQVGDRILHTQIPKRMSSIITHKPPGPGDTYEDPSKIPLLNEDESDSGFSIGGGRHIPNPGNPACCLPDGRCVELDPALCVGKAGGVPGGAGSTCLGDNNGDGIDDACPARPCEECGPGPHWIHEPQGCPPGGFGQDTMPSGAFAGVDLNNDCVADVNLILGGPVTIGKRGPNDDSFQFPGLRPNDGHLDVIDTQILFMQLQGGGATMTAGAGLGVFPLPPSRGAIAETANPSVADSFFDVFFELDDGLGRVLYNRTAVRVQTAIDCLPPDGFYAHITGCLPLYRTPTGQIGDQPVANLVSAGHFTYPGCCFGGTCQNLPTAVCQAENGKVVPDCLGDSDNNDVDDACEQQACCLPQGDCAIVIPARCRAANGVPLGPDSKCEGDGNKNGRDDACEIDEPCEACGPGEHWVDQCHGGADIMPTGALVGIARDDGCRAELSAVLFGPVHVVRSNPRDDSLNFPGTRPIDGHRDVMDTEIVSMQLNGGGMSIVAGGGMGHGGVLRRSFGAIAEQPTHSAAADSFFDVFVEIDIGGGTLLYNHIPLTVKTKIDCLPPVATYIHVTECIPLYDSPFGGDLVAFLAEARHGTYPGCGSDVAGDCYQPHDTPFCNREPVCRHVCELLPQCCTDQWDERCVDAATADLVSSVPAHLRSLPWTRFHTVRFTFDAPIAAPGAGELLIQELLEGAGNFGPNLNVGANFSFAVEPGNVLRIGDNGSHFTHGKWYGIRNVGGWNGVSNFEVQYVCMKGDSNNDLVVLFSDLGFINVQVPSAGVADDNRRDVNRDGSVLFSDLGAANVQIPSNLVPKPGGH